MTQAFDGLLYADAFDCVLTLEEIHRFSRVRTTKEQLRSWLELSCVSNFIHRESGFYYLHDRKNIVATRVKAMTRARKLNQRSTRIARWIQLLPFVRGIVLTGSVAAGDADPEADIDFLVIVAESKMPFVFFVLGGLSRLSFRKLFCPNYYLSESHLSMRRRDFYVAREISQAIPLTGVGGDFFIANDWVNQELPNGGPKANQASPITGTSFIQKSLEFLCNRILRKNIEVRLKSLAENRLTHHYQLQSIPVPEIVKKGFQEGRELRFHFRKRADNALRRYEKNQEAMLRHLEQFHQ
ncbi:nucleotidyltransferase domain-containing protein [bacterium]|nr:nucleotidyltransferase domain-containing protein [bacterium]